MDPEEWVVLNTHRLLEGGEDDLSKKNTQAKCWRQENVGVNTGNSKCVLRNVQQNKIWKQ